MLGLTSLRRKSTILTLSAIAIFCCYLGHAQINPAQVAATAMLCFNNKLIYDGCDQEYRLKESGHLNIPCEATNEYCNGPCLSETKVLLNCINRIAAGFRFSNQASTQVIRNALDAGCSYSSQRGIFNVGNDLPSETCNLISSAPAIKFQQGIAIIVGCFLLLFQHH